MPLCLIAVYSVGWNIFASTSITSIAVSVSRCNNHVNIYFPSSVFGTSNLEIFRYINICTGRSRWSYSLRRGLHLLDSYNRRFESRWWQGYSSLVCVLCCVGSGLCDKLITGIEESYRLCVCVSNFGWSRIFKKGVFGHSCSFCNTKRLFLLAQCFPSYQHVPSPPPSQWR